MIESLDELNREFKAMFEVFTNVQKGAERIPSEIGFRSGQAFEARAVDGNQHVAIDASNQEILDELPTTVLEGPSAMAGADRSVATEAAIQPPMMGIPQWIDETQQFANQGKLQIQESDRRFYENIKVIRVCVGMPPIDYLCDSIGSESPTIIDQGEQDAEETEYDRSVEFEASVVKDSPRVIDWNFKAPSECVLGDSGVELIKDDDGSSTQEIESPIADVSRESDKREKELQIQLESSKEDHWEKPSDPVINEISEEPQSRQESYTVNADPLEVVIAIASKELRELVVLLIELIEIRLVNSSTNLVGYLGNFSAGKVFEEMPSLILVDGCLDFDCFKPKSVSFGMMVKQGTRNWPYDRGKFDVGKRGMCCLQSVGTDMLSKYHKARKLMKNGPETLPFDRGVDVKSGNVHEIPSCILIFDPGGIQGGLSADKFLASLAFVLLRAKNMLRSAGNWSFFSNAYIDA